MSQLLSALLAANEDKIAEAVATGIGDLIDDGRAKSADLVVAVNDALGDEVLDEDGVNKALDSLEDLREPAKDVSLVAIGWVVGYLEDGDEANARRAWLEREATFAERQAAITSAGDAAQRDREARDAAFDSFLRAAKGVGRVALKVLATMTLGALV